MKSYTPNLLHLKQLSKPISSGLLICKLFYLLAVVHSQGIVSTVALYVCADPIVLFVPGVECGLLRMYGVM